MTHAISHRCTVLVIEDDAAQRDTLRRQLEARDLRVVVAVDGLQRLAELDRCHPDAVLSDIRMPAMDGLEFARRLRRNPQYRGVPLIAVTGLNDPDDVMATWRAGFDDHLPKPVSAQALDRVVDRAMRRSAGRPEPSD
jgi:two-component system phosphate regulon response regulator PhoB